MEDNDGERPGGGGRGARSDAGRNAGRKRRRTACVDDSDEGQAESSGGESSRGPTREVRLTRGRRGRGKGEALTYVESEQESEEEGEGDWN